MCLKCIIEYIQWHIHQYILSKWTFITFCNIYTYNNRMTMYRHVLTNICGVSSYIHMLNLLISYSARQSEIVLLIIYPKHSNSPQLSDSPVLYLYFVVFLYFCEASWKYFFKNCHIYEVYNNYITMCFYYINLYLQYMWILACSINRCW